MVTVDADNALNLNKAFDQDIYQKKQQMRMVATLTAQTLKKEDDA